VAPFTRSDRLYVSRERVSFGSSLQQSQNSLRRFVQSSLWFPLLTHCLFAVGVYQLEFEL
jgi:hypothetical protein